MDASILNSLFEEQERRPLTVSELNEKVKTELEQSFSSVWIEGEIVGFFIARSGHWYFQLHDSDSQIKATCFKGTNWRIRFEPFDGLQVRLRGRLTVYPPRGEYQIVVESLEPVGEGALTVAYEQVKEKLGKEGLFDEKYKRPLPYFPQRIGVVTSRNGAAFFDIINVIMRRTRTVNLVLIPTLVQGESAPEEIRNAILAAQLYNDSTEEGEKIDVLIVGRGGGSPEDLWAFNEERVARTIFESEIPVISAVGHETDFTIADLVADVRAATPSAAAEMVAEREDLIETQVARAVNDLGKYLNLRLLHLKGRLREASLSPVFIEFPQALGNVRRGISDQVARISATVSALVHDREKKLLDLARTISPARLSTKLGEKKTRLAILMQREEAAARKVLDLADEALKIRMASLDALSPLAVLNRGFSLAKNSQGEILRDAGSVRPGDALSLQLAKGSLETEVTKIIIPEPNKGK